VSRAHTVLDHQARDGVSGLASVVGGKLTMYRKMAEDAVDVVCARLGADRPCRTPFILAFLSLLVYTKWGFDAHHIIPVLFRCGKRLGGRTVRLMPHNGGLDGQMSI